nr:amidohydrolase family protein [Sphingomonas colocasiae]
MAAWLLASAGAALSQGATAEYDLVIRGGRVLDGAGNPWISADVAVKDGRIVKVGPVKGKGAKEIDAKGRYVAPGFIDMMDQSSRSLLRNGGAENKLLQGVTTVITGEGGPPVPAAELPAYFDRLEKQGIAVNLGTYYASTQARRKVMGDADGRPTPAQLDEMSREVDIAMRGGAFGISSALIYAPSSFQTTSDLVTLARAASRCGAIYATHMRDEASNLIPAIEEAIEIGEKGGVKVEIFHLKAATRIGWGKLMPQALSTIETARDRGVDVAANMYLYTASGTGLEITVPAWVWAGGKDKGLALLKDPKVRERLKKEVAAGPQPDWPNHVAAAGGWDNIMLANGRVEKYAQYQGMSIAKIAAALGKDPADTAWDILIEAQPERATAVYFTIGEADIRTALRRPWVSIGSDAGASIELGKADGDVLPHPRAYGNHARTIAEYVRNNPVLTLEDAVRKMTSWPAERMGLSDRGLVREGMRADIVVFDYAKIQDNATFAQPLRPSSGIDDVIVNGVPTIAGGKPTGARAGVALRHQCVAGG